MAPNKINVKERFSDGEIDLSMSELQEVPVKEIAVIKNVFSLDVSNNNLKSLPANFASLTYLTRLDLSKNQLAQLPENFGNLTKLKHLDLYQNQLQYLPLSFSKLKALKWLDLKDNPLVSAVAKVAGPCLDTKQCQSCAKDVVNFFVQVQEQITNDIEARQKDRQKQLEVTQQKQNEDKKAKKREKKQKPQNGPVRENPAVKPAVKKTKKVSVTETKSSAKSVPIFKLIFSLVVFMVVGLFVLTSVNYKYTTEVEPAVTRAFSYGVGLLPPDYREYGAVVSSFVKSTHEKTGNATINVVNYVKSCDNCIYVYSKVSEFVDLVHSKMRELYKLYVS